MRTLLAIAIASAILGGCAIVVAPGADGDYQVSSGFSSAVQGDGVIKREQRMVGTVQGLEVGGSMLVDVRVGPATSLAVEADSNLLPLIRTDIVGDTLRISTSQSIRSSNPVRIIYTVPRLTDLRAGGSGRVVVEGLNGAPLAVRQGGSGNVRLAGSVASFDASVSGSGQLDAASLDSGSATLGVSGSGRMDVGRVHGDYANVKLSGSGSVRAGGTVRALTVRTSGSGQARLADLASDQADLGVSGSGGISARVQQALVAETSGSGSIQVTGNPAQRSVSGKHVQVM
jgi:hypothetical protein